MQNRLKLGFSSSLSTRRPVVMRMCSAGPRSGDACRSARISGGVHWRACRRRCRDDHLEPGFHANLADACRSIIFGTGVLPLANYHPAMTAAQVAMIDHLVGGRLVLGVGPGVVADAEAIRDLHADRRRKSQEALDHMSRIWREAPPYRIEGDLYRTTTERSFDPGTGHHWADPALARRSMELAANEVWPRIDPCVADAH